MGGPAQSLGTETGPWAKDLEWAKGWDLKSEAAVGISFFFLLIFKNSLLLLGFNLKLEFSLGTAATYIQTISL